MAVKDRRKGLPQGASVTLCSKTGSPLGQVTIRREIGRGGSFICYEAVDEQGFPGTLKEFFPMTVNGTLMHLTRGKDLSLVPGDPAFADLLAQGMERVERSHRNLRDIQCENEAARNCFSYCRLCWAGGTVYTFFPADKVGQTYRTYLKTLNADYRDQPQELRLLNILCIMRSLCQTVDMLAGCRYFSFDISPDNFMVIRSVSGDPINDMVYIFDTDTLTHADDILQRCAALPEPRADGFNSPRITPAALRRQPSLCYEADPYSVLAVLFYSLTGKYFVGDPEALEELLRHSALIRRCRAMKSFGNAGAFMSSLLDLYRETAFAHLRGEEGLSCCQVLDGLDRLIGLVESARREYSMDWNSRTEDKPSYSPETMLANVLYKYPLYSRAGDEDIRVLILGCGTLGKAAFKLVFATGQVMKRDPDGDLVSRGLHIALADQAADIKGFLDSMPALKSFAKVGGGPWDKHSPHERYADIRTVKQTLTEDTVGEILDKYPANYILCCLGSDKADRRLAAACVKHSRAAGTRPFIGYVQGGTDKPVNVRGARAILPISDHRDIDPELLTMAFNEHYLYDRFTRERVGRSIIRRGFRDSYNFQSNVASVLHVRYKLESLGIRTGDPAKAAEQFKAQADRETIEALACLEHRRWNANMIAEGYDVPGSLDYIPGLGDHRDRTHKLHPILVPSGLDSELCDSFDWDRDDLEGLDPLDRTSVELYRFYRDHLGCNDEEIMSTYDRLRALVSRDQRTVEDFQALSEAIGMIFTGLRYGADNFDHEYERFLGTLDRRRELYDPSPDEKELQTLLGQLKRLLFIRTEYLRQRNYKDLDRMFVQNIPFILKARETVLYQSLRSLRGDSLWAVGHALDLDVRRIFWVELLQCDRSLGPESLKEQLDAILEVYSSVLCLREYRDLYDSGRLCLLGRADEDTAEAVKTYVARRCQELDIPMGDIELKLRRDLDLEAAVKRLLDRRGDDLALNGFTGDSLFHELFRNAGARDLEDYEDCLFSNSLNVREYMSLYGAGVISENYSGDREDHRLLWGMFAYDYIYEGAGQCGANPESLWMWTCKLLDASRRSVLAGEIPDRRIEPGMELALLETRLELAATEEPRAMLWYLKRMGLITDVSLEREASSHMWGASMYEFDDSFSTGHSFLLSFKYPAGTDTASIIMSALQKYRSSQYRLCLRVEYDHKTKAFAVKVKDRNFQLLDPAVKPTGRDAKEQERVLNYYRDHRAPMDALIEQLKKAGCLQRMEGGAYRFRDPAAEALLTNEGALLELFIYRALICTGEFSSVAMNVYFQWDKDRRDPVTNELDVVAVKDKQAVFISAKACYELKNEMLQEIAAIAGRFGAVPVLISGNSDTRPARIKRRARDMDGVYVISREDMRGGGSDAKGLTERLRRAGEKDEKLLARRILALLDQELI